MSRSRLRVCHVITRLVHGGAQLVVLDLLRGLDRDRFELELVAGTETGSEGSLWDEARALGVEITAIPSLVRPIRPWRDLQALRALRRHFARTRPDIVHAHTSKAGLLGCVAAHRARVTGIVLAPHGHILGADAQIPGVPSRGLKRGILAMVARRNTRYASVVVCPNETEREDGVRHGLWRNENSVTVGNGIDTDRFRPLDRGEVRTEEGWPVDTPVIGLVARLSPEKGIDIAISAVRDWPEATLIVVGDGPLRAALAEQASGLGDRVRFLGLRTDVARLVAGFDLLWVPSWTEAHGLVAAESLSAGTPVVATDVGGLRSLVIDEGEADPATGRRVPPGDAAALRHASVELLGSPETYLRLSTQGRARIEERFSLHSMIRETAALYDRLVERE